MLPKTLALLTASLVLAGAPIAPAEAGKKDNSIVYATELAPESIDPYFTSVWIGIILSHHVWDTLIYRDPVTSEYKGQLATSWKWIDDKTLDVELRKGVKFHNGADFTADDVVFTLNFAANPDSNTLMQQFSSWMAKVEKIDDFKVRIIAKKPTPAAIEYLSGPLAIYPHKYYQEVGTKGMNANPIGTGPFKVVKHDPGRIIELVRNSDHFDGSNKGKPKVEKVTVRYIPDRQTEMAEAASGGIDLFMNVTADEAQQARARPNLQAKSGESMRVNFLNFNTQKNSPTPPLADIRVRQAILHAVDRKAIIASLVGEGARVLHTLCSPGQVACTSEGATEYEYNPQKAKALLKEAGYPDGFQMDLYAYRERNQMEAIIGFLAEVGIKANLRYTQYGTLRDAARAGSAGFIQTTWASYSVNDVTAFTPVFFKFGPDDITRDEKVRDLLEKGDTTIEPKPRQDAYKEALQIISKNAYTFPLYSLPVHFVATKDLRFNVYRDSIPRMWEMYYE